MLQACTPAASAASIGEPHEVVRIRLWDQRSASAVLSEMFVAEQVLARWGAQATGETIGFEVTFTGGRVVQGSHAFYKAGKRNVMFGKHVRALLGSEPVAPGGAPHAGVEECGAGLPA